MDIDYIRFAEILVNNLLLMKQVKLKKVIELKPHIT